MPLLGGNRNRNTLDDVWTKPWSMQVVRNATKSMVPYRNFVRQYIYTNFLGMGSFAKVLLFVRKDDEDDKLAVKWYMAHESPSPSKYWILALREIRLLRMSTCPNIVAYKYACFNPEAQQMFLYMEHCDAGSMKAIVLHRDLRAQLTPPLKAYVIKCMANALAFVHGKHVLHRDVKASNVLLTTAGQVKLADFDMCCRLDSPDIDNIVGTRAIMSPEMMGMRGRHRRIDAKTDIWSLGIIIRQMETGYKVYPTESRRKILEIIAGDTREFPDVHPESLRKLLQSCLQIRPIERASAEEILQSDFLKLAASAEEFKELVMMSLEWLDACTDFFETSSKDGVKPDYKAEMNVQSEGNAEGDGANDDKQQVQREPWAAAEDEKKAEGVEKNLKRDALVQKAMRKQEAERNVDDETACSEATEECQDVDKTSTAENKTDGTDFGHCAGTGDRTNVENTTNSDSGAKISNVAEYCVTEAKNSSQGSAENTEGHFDESHSPGDN